HGVPPGSRFIARARFAASAPTFSRYTKRRFRGSPGAPRPSIARAIGDRAVSEEVPFLDQRRDFRRDHRLPGGVAFAELREHFAGEDVQVILVVEVEALDVAVLHEVLVE